MSGIRSRRTNGELPEDLKQFIKTTDTTTILTNNSMASNLIAASSILESREIPKFSGYAYNSTRKTRAFVRKFELVNGLNYDKKMNLIEVEKYMSTLLLVELTKFERGEETMSYLSFCSNHFAIVIRLWNQSRNKIRCKVDDLLWSLLVKFRRVFSRFLDGSKGKLSILVHGFQLAISKQQFNRILTHNIPTSFFLFASSRNNRVIRRDCSTSYKIDTSRFKNLARFQLLSVFYLLRGVKS